MARLAGTIRRFSRGAYSVQSLGQAGSVEEAFWAPGAGCRQWIRNDRLDDRAGTSAQRRGAEKRGCEQAIGRSKGGLSTKIHTTVDALGNPVGFHLTGGQACDLEGADVLLPQLDADILLADKGFDADQRVLNPWQQAGKVAVIPPKANRKVQREYDKELYKARHLIENFFAKLKLFRAIATRYDKTARNFLAAVYFAATLIWLIWWQALAPHQ
jgi:transposase